jgi:hypothetical protein
VIAAVHVYPSRSVSVVGCVTQLVKEHPLNDWKEVLALLATFAKSEQFTVLCEALGDRLVAQSTAATCPEQISNRLVRCLLHASISLSPSHLLYACDVFL